MRRAVRLTPLVLMVVVDVVLIAWLISWIGDNRNAAASSDEPATRTTIAPDAASAPTGTISVVSTGDMVLRLTAGTCTGEGRPLLEISADTGQTFSEVAVPVLDADGGAQGASRTVLAARATTPTEIQVVAGDLDCTARGFATTDGGATWTEAPYDDWYVDASRTNVITPVGDAVDPGCAVRSLSAVSAQNVKVLCDDNTIRGTNDTGQTWVALGEINDGTAVTMTARFDGYGIARRPECASQVMSTDDAGASWTEVGCIDPELPVTNISGTAERLVAATDTQTWTSTDGGVTWVAPGQESPDA